jgi:hypothetical protein
MSNTNSDTDIKTYKYCAVQLSFFSLIKTTALICICGGISWACIIYILDVVSIIELITFDTLLVNLIVFPGMAAVAGTILSVTGYPLYLWVCKKRHGQKLAGIFHNPHD